MINWIVSGGWLLHGRAHVLHGEGASLFRLMERSQKIYLQDSKVQKDQCLPENLELPVKMDTAGLDSPNSDSGIKQHHVSVRLLLY